MNRRVCLVVLLSSLFPLSLMAVPEKLQTLDGNSYSNFSVSNINNSHVKIMNSKGVHNIKLGQIKDEDLKILGVNLSDPIVIENIKGQREELKWAIKLEEIRKQRDKLTLPSGKVIDTKSITDLNPMALTYRDATGAKSIQIGDLPSEIRELFGYNKAQADAYAKNIQEQINAQKLAASVSQQGQAKTSTVGNKMLSSSGYPSNMTKDQIIAERNKVRTQLRDKSVSAADRKILEGKKLELDDLLRKANTK
ncbi:MAG: hypothetical protein AAGA18_11610 [Verrucomicrobiota bacterium]